MEHLLASVAAEPFENFEGTNVSLFHDLLSFLDFDRRVITVVLIRGFAVLFWNELETSLS